jgi:hypothetical protein
VARSTWKATLQGPEVDDKTHIAARLSDLGRFFRAMWTPAGSANQDLGHRSLDSMYTWHQPITSYQEADDANRGPSSRKERFGVGIGECAGTVTHIFNGKVCVREEKQRFDLGTFVKTDVRRYVHCSLSGLIG